MHDPTIRTSDDLEQTIERVSFERSCLDMGWAWDTAYVGGGGVVAGMLAVKGWLIRCSFQRPDRETGAIGRGFGRWWFVAEGTTVSGVVKTMYAAAKLIVEHELLEAFEFDGRRPFDPHAPVQALIDVGREEGSARSEPCPDCEDGQEIVGHCAECDAPRLRTCRTCGGTGKASK